MKLLTKYVLSTVVFVAVFGFAVMIYFFNHTLKFPGWFKPFEVNAPECVNADIVQKKFHPDYAKVTVFNIQTDQGLLRAWHIKALKNRTGKGVILVHGGGGDHNLLNPYANYLSQKGWDSLAVDLPNHGCSYNNHKGIQFGKVESENFDKFYQKAESLFKVEGIIATSLGSTVAAQYSFKTGKPDKLILENPMLSVKRIITDQKSYYVPFIIKPFLEWELLFLNKDLVMADITTLKPAPNQKILIMYGSNDKLTPPNIQAQEFATAWKDQTQIHIIEGAWHAQLMQHAPGEVEKLVDDFLLK